MDIAQLPAADLILEIGSWRMTGLDSNEYRPSIAARSKARLLGRACRIACNLDVRTADADRLRAEERDHERRLAHFHAQTALNQSAATGCRN